MREYKLGTPKTLDEAIKNALCIGPLCEVPERSYHVLRDFMAQKFGVAYMKLADNDEALKVVEELFAKLTERPAEIAQLKNNVLSGSFKPLGVSHGIEKEGLSQSDKELEKVEGGKGE